MSTRETSCTWAPTPTALVLAFLLVVSSSWWRIADGIRTTPHTSGPADAGVLDPAAAGASRGAYKPDRAAASQENEGPVVLEEEELWLRERAATGSRLPNCAHACGPCSPCRRVMVSFKCAQASESCPIAYRCMCRGRFFRVPSL